MVEVVHLEGHYSALVGDSHDHFDAVNDSRCAQYHLANPLKPRGPNQKSFWDLQTVGSLHHTLSPEEVAIIDPQGCINQIAPSPTRCNFNLLICFNEDKILAISLS